MFYHAFKVDAFILNKLFGYKILENKKCGFPESVLEKVITILENNHISYKIIYHDEETKVKDFVNNKYLNFYQEALIIMDKTIRIDLAIDKIKQMDENAIDYILGIIENVSDK